MDDLYEDELVALWKWFDFKTNEQSVSEFVAFANSVNATQEAGSSPPA